MYFPYLRGKQFELIALREICSFVDHDNLISPIIEPVKETTITLEKTLDCLVASNLNFNLILNPKVGDIKNIDTILKIKNEKLTGYENYQPAIIIDNKTNWKKIQKFVSENVLVNITIICEDLGGNENIFFDFLQNNSIKYVVVNENNNSKRFLRQIKRLDIDKIILTDRFKNQRRNVDYSKNDNERFSEEHLFFDEEGFVGFSDYLIVGQEYSDTGFLPYAVAIHLTYLNKDKEFWVRHFVSDSNEDTTDVAGKFSEALKKLIDFINDLNLNTEACKEFRELAKYESYPGLGSIKKLSIKHHIELVYDYLKNRD